MPIPVPSPIISTIRIHCVRVYPSRSEILARLEILVDRVYQMGIEAGLARKPALSKRDSRQSPQHSSLVLQSPVSAPPANAYMPAAARRSHLSSSSTTETSTMPTLSGAEHWDPCVSVSVSIPDCPTDGLAALDGRISAMDGQMGCNTQGGLDGRSGGGRKQLGGGEIGGMFGVGGQVEVERTSKCAAEDPETVQYRSGDEECYISAIERELTLLVRKRLLPCLRDLIQHGLRVVCSNFHTMHPFSSG